MATRYKVTLKGEDLGFLDVEDLTMDQAMQLEDKTGLAIADLASGMARGSARALQAVVWLQRLRQGKLGADLHENFKFGELDISEVEEEGPTKAVKAA